MTIPAGPYYPTNGLVAVAWLAQRVPGLTPGMVATSLPRDTATWADAGFVQVTPVTGTPDVDLDVRHPIVQVDCWAMTPNSAKPPKAKAARLSELIRVATHDGARYSQPVVMPEHYLGAIVLSAYMSTEPADVPDDPSGFARVTFDLALDWARA